MVGLHLTPAMIRQSWVNLWRLPKGPACISLTRLVTTRSIVSNANQHWIVAEFRSRRSCARRVRKRNCTAIGGTGSSKKNTCYLHTFEAVSQSILSWNISEGVSTKTPKSCTWYSKLSFPMSLQKHPLWCKKRSHLKPCRQDRLLAATDRPLSNCWGHHLSKIVKVCGSFLLIDSVSLMQYLRLYIVRTLIYIYLCTFIYIYIYILYTHQYDCCRGPVYS